MPDTLTIMDGRAIVTTEEGTQIKHHTDKFEDMLGYESTPPLGNLALPDGVKFVAWRPPNLVICHQQPACIRLVRWIAPNSPAKYGTGVKYTKHRLSMPYAVTFAQFTLHNKEQLRLGESNELYFSNSPIISLSDTLSYPALLNVSVMGDKNKHTWVCTQYLQHKSRLWTDQLQALLAHLWDGGFNLSSEAHEGESWYGRSAERITTIDTVDKWEASSTKDDGFGLTVKWLPSPFTVQDVINRVSGDNPKQHVVRRFMNYAGTKSTIADEPQKIDKKFLDKSLLKKPKAITIDKAATELFGEV